MVSNSDTLQGLANYYTGANLEMRVTGVPRYSTATLAGVYSGVNAQNTIGANGLLTPSFSLAAGVNVQSLQCAIPQTVSFKMGSIGGGLTAQPGSPTEPPPITS